MTTLSHFPRRLMTLPAAVLCTATIVSAQPQETFVPQVGQPGKDVVWVPTPPELVERMLDMAGVTPRDFVIDLGSGDGRNVIAAARRGARALGVESTVAYEICDGPAPVRKWRYGPGLGEP